MFWITAKYPDKSFAIYDKDPEDTVYLIGEEGKNVLAVLKPRRVICPWFEVQHKTNSPKEAFNFFLQRLKEYAEELEDAFRSITFTHKGNTPNTIVISVMNCPAYDPVTGVWAMTVGMMLMHFTDVDYLPWGQKQFTPSQELGEKLPEHTKPEQAQEHSLLVCRALSLY